MSSQQTSQWNGLLDGDAHSIEHRALRDQLADDAKAGDWDEVFRVLETDRNLHPNLWRPDGPSWYTPLHQAAWHGAPLEVVEWLLELGAWRTLRTARGLRAVDIAEERGHEYLLGLLRPETNNRPADHARLDEHLAGLVESRIRPQIELRLRHPASEVLTELPDRTLWYPVPGMYGGFKIRLRDNYLYVTSWSRIVGGSGRAHVVTSDGVLLAESGFV